MTQSTATLPQFAKYCWEQLPIRKHCIGEEMVNDCVILAVQFWPVEKMCQCDHGSPDEARAFDALLLAIRRVAEFVHGEERFSAYWKLGLRSVLMDLMQIVGQWWRRSKRNRGNLIIWRRKWMGNE